MEPQSHPLLHFFVRMKPTPTNVFLQIIKMWKPQGIDLGCRENVEVFLCQISEVYPSPDWHCGDGRYHAKGWISPIAFKGVLALWRVAAPSATKKRTHPLCSSLLVSISNSGRIHFTLRSPPEQYRNNCVDLVCFHYACLLPYRWQYRYVTTVLPDFARNVFYGGCSVFFWVPLYIYIYIDRLLGIVVSTSDCHPRSSVFDSRLYPRNSSGSIGSGTGFTQPHEDNWVAIWYEK